MYQKPLLAVLGVLAILLCASSASASLFEPVRDRQLVCEAPEIVRGEVTAVRSEWDDQHTAIWTRATVQVKDVHRGKLPLGSTITVKEIGGTVGGYTIHADGFPTFQVGDEVVVLLRPWEDDPGAYQVWGYGRGLFRVDRRGGRGATAVRYDVVESGRPTMFTDRLAPTSVLEALGQQLAGLASSCGAGAQP